MIRAAILSLLLAGCASHNMRETTAHGDMDRDGCIAYRCKSYCRASATPEQIAAFHAGTIDEAERKQLKRLGWGLTADAGSTIAALGLCEGLREANPILGPSPSPVVVIAASGITYLIARHDAAKSPAWCSSERTVRIAANVRLIVAISNVLQLLSCPQ